jgi:hypothetical protein
MCLLGPYEIDFSDGGIVVVDFNFFASRSKEFPIDASFIFPGRMGKNRAVPHESVSPLATTGQSCSSGWWSSLANNTLTVGVGFLWNDTLTVKLGPVL